MVLITIQPTAADKDITNAIAAYTARTISPSRDIGAGHLFSGQPRDTFPPGHALHVGALAAAGSLLPPLPRRVLLTLAVMLSTTRVVLLAHWASDVVAGFAAGALIERLVRPITMGPVRRPDTGET
jgi:undecaprenyl-diphosphatase